MVIEEEKVRAFMVNEEDPTKGITFGWWYAQSKTFVPDNAEQLDG